MATAITDPATSSATPGASTITSTQDVPSETEIFAISERVSEYSAEKPFIALEFYPPRTETGVDKLKERMNKLRKLAPLYVDFTWGAGGTTSDLTMDLCLTAQTDYNYVANMHLTCTNMPREKVDIALKVSKEKKIRNILALRGDPPVGQVDWKPVESGFSCALDLVKHIKKYEAENGLDNFFNITVAGYPEGHPAKITKFGELENETDTVDLSKYDLTESEKVRVVQIGKDLMVCRDAAFDEEMKYLKSKVDAGAKMIVTQMFYDADVFIAFAEACKKYEITVPVIPGIMCLTSYGGFKRMSSLCKTRTPPDVLAMIEASKDDTTKMKNAGIELGIRLCKKLLAYGVPGLHFYTLNLDEVVVGILSGLKLFQGEY